MKKLSKKDLTKYIMVTIIITVIFSISVVILNYKVFSLSKTIDNLKNELINKETKINALNTSNEKDDSIEPPKIKSTIGTISLEKLNEIDLTNYNKIMISTHPDDEMFWGGGHLLEDNYLVVCVTCGMDDNRLQEFQTMMGITNDKYITLSYPRSVDPSLNREFNWEAAGYLTQDLNNILNLKDWDMIVTHNPDGEYGHKYHKLTSQIVTSLVKDKDKLFYFEKYYYASEAKNYTGPLINDALYQKKCKVIYDTYVSQRGSIPYHKQMFNNENFVKYADWQ